MNRDEGAQRYEAEVSHDARVRQQEELRARFPCCGELRTAGHHPACSLRPKDEVIAGQSTLI